MSRLESRLGAQLLNRTTRRLNLTEVGAAFYEHCARAVAEVAEAELMVTRLHTEPRGMLKVNVPMSFGQLHIAPAVPEFLARYPDVTIDMRMTDQFIDVIEEGFDLAIRIANLADSILIARRLAPCRLVACAAPSYLAQRGMPEAPEDLAHHNCLNYTLLATHNEWLFAGRAGEGPLGVRVRGTFQADNGEALRHAMLAGVGIGVMPTFIIGGDLKSGALREILPDYPPPPRTVYAVYPPIAISRPRCARSSISSWRGSGRRPTGTSAPTPSRVKGAR